MKKSIVALAALAATGAFAQSSLSIYGAVDAAVTYFSSEGVTKTGLGNSQVTSSKLGFTGTEDLGGGLKANFKLEAGLANDTGNGKGVNTNNQPSGAPVGSTGLVFNRYSYVGLSGGFGEVRLGGDYLSTYQFMVGAGDPFGNVGPANSVALMLNLGLGKGQPTAAHAANVIGYITPTMGGFSAKLQYHMGENASNSTTKTPPGVDNSDDGNGYSVTLSYANGPISVTLGQQVAKGTVATSPASNGDYTERGLVASYNFGVAKVLYNYVGEDLITVAASSATNRSNLLGLVVPFGAANFKASYIRSVENLSAGAGDNTGTLVGLGVDYSLSKRTMVYGAWSRVTNDNGDAFSAGAFDGAAGVINPAVRNHSSQGLAIGLVHRF